MIEKRGNPLMPSAGKLLIQRNEPLRGLKEEHLPVESLPGRDALFAKASSPGHKKAGSLERQALEVIEAAASYKLVGPLVVKDAGFELNTERKSLLRLGDPDHKHPVRPLIGVKL